jgi:hypothetical protein
LGYGGKGTEQKQRNTDEQVAKGRPAAFGSITLSLVVTPTVGIKSKTVDDLATAMPTGIFNKTPFRDSEGPGRRTIKLLHPK